MPLLPEDARYLVERNINHVVQEEAGMTCLVLQAWPLPPGLNQQRADILIRLAPGYPDVAPDMWWVAWAVWSGGSASSHGFIRTLPAPR